MPFGRARLSLSRSFWRRDPLHERGRDAHDALTPEAPTRRCLSNAWADALRHGATCSAVFWIPGKCAWRGNARPYDFGVGRVVNVEPIFVVSDVARAVAHYEQLGFSASHHDEGYARASRWADDPSRGTRRRS
jgi:hypothetical protein